MLYPELGEMHVKKQTVYLNLFCQKSKQQSRRGMCASGCGRVRQVHLQAGAWRNYQATALRPPSPQRRRPTQLNHVTRTREILCIIRVP